MVSEYSRAYSKVQIILSDTHLPILNISDLGNIFQEAGQNNIQSDTSISSSVINSEDCMGSACTRSTCSVGSASTVPEKSNELLSLLKKSVKGIGVIKKFELGHQFEQDTRLILADAIISEEILRHKDYKISASRMLELATLIETTFPPEKAATHYIPYKLNQVRKKRVLAKGKLYDKYCGYRSFLRSTEVLPSAKKIRLQTVGKPIILGYRENLKAIEECDDTNVKVDWLKNCLEPWPTVEKYWRETAKTRIELLTSSEAITSHEYCMTFKALQQPLGLNLVKIDFEIVHPEKTLSFYANWPEFQKNILRYCYTKKTKDSSVNALLKLIPNDILSNNSDDSAVQITSDCFTVIALRLLGLLLPCPYIKVAKKPCWRPTKVEVQNEFLLHVTSIGELETELAMRKRKHLKYGLTEQPITIVVGENLLAIEQCFVSINDVKYPAGSIIAAIDATFQSFFALQLQYPREAELPWLIIQKRIYNIEDEAAKNFPSVNTLLNDLTCVTN